MKSFKAILQESGLSNKDFKKDMAAVKAGKADPSEMAHKWGERGGAFLNFLKLESAMDSKKSHFVYQKNSPRTKEKVFTGTEEQCKNWIKTNARHYEHKGRDFVIYKGKYPEVKPRDAVDFKYVAESTLPPHLAKFFDKNGNPIKKAQKRIEDGRKKRSDTKVSYKDVTPKGYGPNESKSDYTVSHKTFSSAVQHAIEIVEKRGFEVDEDEWDRKVALGPRKPAAGKTNSYTIALLKNGKETKRNLQMQVYYDEGRYELNMYIS